MTNRIAMINLATDLADGHCRAVVFSEHSVPQGQDAYEWGADELLASLEDAEIKHDGPAGEVVAEFRRILAGEIEGWYEQHREEMFDLATEELEVLSCPDGHLYFRDHRTGRWNRVADNALVRFGEFLTIEKRRAFVYWRATTSTVEMPDDFHPEG